MTTAISIQHACKTYANGYTALQDVSFDVAEGEFFALLGPNGAGKTTLISAMAGLIKLTAGQIMVNGYDVQKQAISSRMSLGVVPQELVFDPFFSVRETLQFQSGYFGIASNDNWIDEILHHLGLTDKADTNTRNLSGGMKRRLMLAQALVHKPPVIILDEPTAGVDIELRHSLWHFINSLNQQGHTIVLTTHYLEEAQAYCSRIAMMKDGQLIALDSTEHLLKNGNSINVKLSLSAQLPKELAHLIISQETGHYQLSIDHYEDIAKIIAVLHNRKIEILNLQIEQADLESVFVELIHKGDQ